MDYIPPLSVYFVWHPTDANTVQPMVDHCSTLLQRDIGKPFSRAMNLPIFYRTSSKKGIPTGIDIGSPKKAIIFVFISKNLLADDTWSNYVETLPQDSTTPIIPVALDNLAFNVQGALNRENFIRVYNYEEAYRNDSIFIAVAHEIYRLALNETFDEKKPGKETALKIFLSHAKDGAQGIKLAKALKSFIENTTLSNFFDTTGIAPGYKFDEEIISNIQDSTMIAIHSDPYSSRYWCQREIQCAKENERPIIAVDCLESSEDRRYPLATNIPGVHVALEESQDPAPKDLFRILTAALLETIRFHYSKMLLGQYQEAAWIPADAIIFSRPPEAADIEKALVETGSKIEIQPKTFVYPEPPVYAEELALLKKSGIVACTPLSCNLVNLQDKRIGISLSEPAAEELIKIGQSSQHLVQLSQDFAKHLLARGATLIYGGDLRNNGFTDFIFKEAQALQARLRTASIHLRNYIAWPIFKGDTADMIEWKAKYRPIATMPEVEPPVDVLDLIPDIETFPGPSDVQNAYVWSRCLSEMRTQMIADCDVRICAGGKHTGYKGKMPGVLEEIMITLNQGKPLFLLGGFGGVTAGVCKFIATQVMPVELTESWQVEHNPGYEDLLDFSAKRGGEFKADYQLIESRLKNINLQNGLSDAENQKLFVTPFIDEALYLVFKGLKNLYE